MEEKIKLLIDDLEDHVVKADIGAKFISKNLQEAAAFPALRIIEVIETQARSVVDLCQELQYLIEGRE